MPLSNMNYNQFQIILLVFFRVGGIIFMAPVLNRTNIPIKIKIISTIIFTGVFIHMKDSVELPYITSLLHLTGAILAELTIGITIGFVAQLIFIGITLGGQLLGLQTGLSIASIFDPSENYQKSLVSMFLSFLTILIFLSFNLHHWFFEAIALSFKMIPLGKISLSPKLLFIILNSFNKLFVIAIKISAPVMATVLILDAIMGILTKLVPQIEVFILSFPLKISSGLLVLALSLNFISILIHRFFGDMPFKIKEVIYILS